MYKPFQDSTFIPVEFSEMTSYSLGDVSVPTVSASAAKTADGGLVLTLVNLDPHKAAKVVGALRATQRKKPRAGR
jgi:alpha-N-arabinofuranosidase